MNASNLGRQIGPTALALHTSVYDGTHGNSELVDRLNDAGVQMLRYPGGSYADIFHFSVPPELPYYNDFYPGTFLPDVDKPHPLTPDKGADPGIIDPWPFAYHASDTHFANFMGLLDATGTEAMITVNYGSSLGNLDAGSGKWLSTKGGQPQEAAAWVAYANADPNIYGTASDVVIGEDEEGCDWKTAGYWAKLRASDDADDYQNWAENDGVYDPVHRFLAANHDAPVGVQYWEVGNEIFGDGYYAPYWNWEENLHGAYDGDRTGDPALSPTTYGTNFVQFASAMKAVDPSIKVGAVLTGPNGVGDDPDPAKNWDRNVLSTAGDAQVEVDGQYYNAMDFGIIHWYVNNDPTEFNNQCTIGQAACEANLLDAPANTTAAAVSLPDTYQGLRDRIDLYTSRDSSTFELHMTEFGYFDPIGDDNVVTGLFAADAYATALEEGATTVHWHEMSKPTFLPGDSENLDEGPTYFAVQVLDSMFDSGDDFVGTTSNSSQLKAHAVRQADGSLSIMLINLLPGSSNDTMVTIDIDGQYYESSGEMWLYGVDQTTPLQSSIGGLGNNFTITVPDRSIVLLLIPAAPGLPGDYNNDGVVNAADYTVWRNAKGTSTALPNDVTPGTVDQSDYTVWRDNYGQSLGSGSAAGVPEPSTGLLAWMAVAGLLILARRRLPTQDASAI